MEAGERGLQTNYVSGTSQMERKKHHLLPPSKSASEEIIKAKSSEGSYCKRNSYPGRNAYENRSALVMRDEKDSLGHDSGQENFHLGQRSHVFDVTLPLHPRSSSGKAVCRKLLHEEEAKPNRQNSHKRVDYLVARILKDKKKYIPVDKKVIGSVPGVEVGDEFQYRVELNMIGLHLQIQGGIDYVKHEGKILATSIVASGGYDDKLDNSDVLIYTGQGGNVMNGGKEPEDQKLERGNLALANNIHEQNPVRVIRSDTKAFEYRTYIYDGLYLVERYWQDVGLHGKLVYKFKLARIPGKELIPNCAVNTVDDEMPPKGCDCTNGCSKLEKCACVAKNGGEIPYNHNRAIVQAKPLVYECGPSCKCPPSCYNRVSQQGIKVQLEIFKTEARGWGVRSLNSIGPGSFIYESVGELLEEKEAERTTSNDKYLFNIGNNYNDGSLWGGLSNVMPNAPSSSCGVVEDVEYGNVGRFVNHSCSPNLYAQNVLYDHEDKRMPHKMLFAAENISPLQELTYHYSYVIDQVYDSSGNIKKKSCFCGSSECTGWL
ncbi:hypothetical protein WN943_005876 [Citrus x changshan-huyou]